MVQSPLCVSPPRAFATPRMTPAITRIRPMIRFRFMGPHSSPYFQRNSQNVRVLERHQLVQSQILKPVLPRLLDELRRYPLHFRADELLAIQVLEACRLHRFHILRRDSLNLHPDQFVHRQVLEARGLHRVEIRFLLGLSFSGRLLILAFVRLRLRLGRSRGFCGLRGGALLPRSRIRPHHNYAAASLLPLPRCPGSPPTPPHSQKCGAPPQCSPPTNQTARPVPPPNP